MVYVGKALRIAFVIYNLPAWLKKDETVTNLLSHLDTRGQKSATVGFVTLRGKPRYVKGNEPVEQPKVLAKRLSLCSHILIGTIMDLA